MIRSSCLAALVGLPGLYFLVAAGVLLVNTQMVVAPVRFAHLSPNRADAEEEVLSTEPAASPWLLLRDRCWRVVCDGVVRPLGVLCESKAKS